MKLYRVHRRLSSGKRYFEQGTISVLPGIKPRVLDQLLRNGCISEVRSPPLEIVKALGMHLEPLLEAGFETVGDVVAAGRDEVDLDEELFEYLDGLIR